MPELHTETTVLEERFIGDTLAEKLSHPPSEGVNGHCKIEAGHRPEAGSEADLSDPDNMNTAGFHFIQELADDLSAEDLALPSLPEVVLSIRRALTDKHSPVDKVVRLIGSDPVLAARLVRIANCVAYHRGVEAVCDLKKAVSRLGYGMVLNVSLAIAIEQVVHGQAIGALKPYLEEIWKHSTQVAAIAHVLAKYNNSINPDEAFLAGLLHEIGKLYILKRAKAHQGLFEHGKVLKAIMTDWHTKIGRALIEHWNLSKALADAVGDHESYDLNAVNPTSLTTVVAIANLLANSLESESEDEELLEDTRTARHLNLDARTCAEVLTSSEEELEALLQALGIDELSGVES